MPSRWRSRPRFDGTPAGERSLAGHERTVDTAAKIGDNLTEDHVGAESPTEHDHETHKILIVLGGHIESVQHVFALFLSAKLGRDGI